MANTTFRVELFANQGLDASGNAEGQTYLGFATVTTDGNGKATFTASNLAAVPAGEVYLTATATNQSTGDTSPFSHYLLAIPTAVQLTSSASSSTFGQSVTFSATVSASAAGFKTPGGSVDFVDTTTHTVLGTAVLSGGTATLSTTAALSVGTHSIVAVYSDNGIFLGSTSPPLTQTVKGASGTSSITANFNGAPIAAGNDVWFNSVLKVSGLGTSPVTIGLQNATISFTAGGQTYNLAVPNALITFSPTATSASTTYDAGTNTWLTTVPSTGLSGNVFLDGLIFPVMSSLPGGIKNLTWQGTFMSSSPGVSIQWQWAAAVYPAAHFSGDYNALEVKPVDDNHVTLYTGQGGTTPLAQNSDHAGTPEEFKQYVIGGATGGGGSNYTGGYSGTAKVQFVQFD